MLCRQVALISCRCSRPTDPAVHGRADSPCSPPRRTPRRSKRHPAQTSVPEEVKRVGRGGQESSGELPTQKKAFHGNVTVSTHLHTVEISLPRPNTRPTAGKTGVLRAPLGASCAVVVLSAVGGGPIGGAPRAPCTQPQQRFFCVFLGGGGGGLMRLYRALKGYSYGSHGFQTTDDGHDHRQRPPSTLSRVRALEGIA